MRIGISTASYFPHLFTEETFDQMVGVGCDICEVFLASHCEYTDDFAKVLSNRLAKARQKGRLDVHSMHTLTNQFEPDLFNVGLRARHDAEDIFRHALGVGKAIGAHNYTFHGATLLKRIEYKFDYDRLSKIVNHIAEIAGEYDIKLCYENVHWAYFSTPEYFRNMKGLCSNIGGVLDIKQAMQSHIDWREFLDVLSDRLVTVHLCDYNEDGSLAMPGRGHFDFVELFRALMDKGYDGPCFMEVYSKNYGKVEELKESFDYLNHCLDVAKRG